MFTSKCGCGDIDAYRREMAVLVDNALGNLNLHQVCDRSACVCLVCVMLCVCVSCVMCVCHVCVTCVCVSCCLTLIS